MEATKIRREMNAGWEPEKKPSLLKRWKGRRLAKKQIRRDRKMAKIEKKLEKLRGVE